MAILLLVASASEVHPASYVAALVLGLLGVAAAVGAFLLFRAFLPADLNRDPRQHLADLTRLGRR